MTAKLSSSDNSEVVVEVSCYQKEKRDGRVVCVQHPDDELDLVIIVPLLPTRLNLALDLLMSFWVLRSLCMALGFMMTREQTAAGTPAPLFVCTGRNFRLGKLEVLQMEGVPAFHHWLPYTQPQHAEPDSHPCARRLQLRDCGINLSEFRTLLQQCLLDCALQVRARAGLGATQGLPPAVALALEGRPLSLDRSAMPVIWGCCLTMQRVQHLCMLDGVEPRPAVQLFMNTARRTAFPCDGLLHSMCSTCNSAVVLAARLSKVPCGRLLLGRPCHAREGHGGVHACVWQGAALPCITAHACMHHLLGRTGPTCVHCDV